MGKGDKRTKRGKIINSTFGVSRLRASKKEGTPSAKTASKKKAKK